jgi:hypothetical protein
MSADLHDQRIGVMAPTQAFFGYVQPATSVSATKVSPRLPATPIGVSLAEIAEIPIPVGHSLHPPPALVLDSQPHVWRALKGVYDGG